MCAITDITFSTTILAQIRSQHNYREVHQHRGYCLFNYNKAKARGTFAIQVMLSNLLKSLPSTVKRSVCSWVDDGSCAFEFSARICCMFSKHGTVSEDRRPRSSLMPLYHKSSLLRQIILPSHSFVSLSLPGFPYQCITCSLTFENIQIFTESLRETGTLNRQLGRGIYRHKSSK